MVSISLRPERYSYGLIKASGLFAVNLPTEALARAGRAEEIPLRVQIVSCDGREVRNA